MTIHEDATGDLTTPYEAVYSLSREFAEEQAKSPAPSIAAYLERVKPDYQPVLFRNLLGLEIESRRSGDDIPKIDDYVSRFPIFEPIIREILMEAASISSSFSQVVNQPLVASSPVPTPSRIGNYRLIGELGRGGMGIVFEAVNCLTGNRVALKTLPVLDGTTLHRFKREFRSLSGINHPNLIGLQQLEADGGQWYFTMDLIEGSSFLDYVRPDGVLDEVRLRNCLAQLVSGVMALHGQNIIHRDLKPSNVMVSHQGKVTILDFGLVLEMDSGTSISRGSLLGAGTPRYMAPEQAGAMKVTAASDWYAVGIMLYEALSGKPLFIGAMGQVLHDKQNRDAPLLTGDQFPTDLATLANRLLRRNPAQRPDARELVKVIAATTNSQMMPMSSGQFLVGRERQLEDLQKAYRQFLNGNEPLTLFIRGRSGEGKTALAEKFLSTIRLEKRTVVMAGRCYDRESVPFKALDTLIDALSNYLISLPAEDAAYIIPDDIGMLVQVFPILQRVEVLAKAIDKRATSLDEAQVRQRAFRSLRSLLSRLDRRRPIVWFVDDLQWGDADSAEALFQVLRPPEAPKLMLIGTYRSDETDSSAFLVKWKELQARHASYFADREVGVGPLTEADCISLVVGVIGKDTSAIRNRAKEFARETQGNPFLLTELAGCFDPDADSFETIPLDEVLTRKLKRLPAEAESLLEVIAVSGQALSLEEASKTAGHENLPMATVSRMRNERLIRLIGSDENPQVDTYHDRVRETILAKMDPVFCKTWHQKLGEQIEKESGVNAENLFIDLKREEYGTERPLVSRVYDLAYHFDASGDQRRGLIYALAGAEQARRQSALEVAVNNYEIARRNQDPEDLNIRFRVAEGNGQALTRLGRYAEANKELKDAFGFFKEPEKQAAFELILGEIAHKQGKLLEAVTFFSSGLRRLGFWVPKTSFGFAIGFVGEAITQTWNSLFPGRLHRKIPKPRDELAIWLFFRLFISIFFMNTLKSFWSHLASLNRSELFPPTSHLAVNYCYHSCFTTMTGWVGRGKYYFDKSIQLGQKFNDNWVLGELGTYQGVSQYVSAKYGDGIRALTDAIIAFEKAADPWETHMAHFHKGCCHFGLGDLKEAVLEARTTFESSVRLGDSRLFCSSYLWARATQGNIPFQNIKVCYPDRPDDIMSSTHGVMAEGHWHGFHGRTGESLASFEKAFQSIKSSGCWNSHMVVVLPELSKALRKHADTILDSDPRMALKLRNRSYRMAKWGARIMWLFPAARPQALREWALILDVFGKTKKAWKVATKSASIALAQKAKFEHAQSLLVCGHIGKKLQKAEAEEQVRIAEEKLKELTGQI